MYRAIHRCSRTRPTLCQLIHSFINGSLQSFVGSWPLRHFRNRFYIVGRTLWSSDQPVARPLPTRRTIQAQNKRAHRHPCLERDSNPQSQLSSERRHLSADTVSISPGRFLIVFTNHHIAPGSRKCGTVPHRDYAQARRHLLAIDRVAKQRYCYAA
jgi:hypothetical protein